MLAHHLPRVLPKDDPREFGEPMPVMFDARNTGIPRPRFPLDQLGQRRNHWGMLTWDNALPAIVATPNGDAMAAVAFKG